MRNGLKTHCPHGHEYTPENTYRAPKTNARFCRACHRISNERGRIQAIIRRLRKAGVS